MSDNNKMPPGSVMWVDLTVPDAEKVKDFYKEVVNWNPQPLSMGEYDDYNMVMPGSEQPAAGICHSRGTNSKLPPYWMIYITIVNMEESLKKCAELGGKIIDGPKNFGTSKMCIIQDPAGAYCALFEQGD